MMLVMLKHQPEQPFCLRHYLSDLKNEALSHQIVAVLSFLQAAGLVDDHENDCEWKVEMSAGRWPEHRRSQ